MYVAGYVVVALTACLQTIPVQAVLAEPGNVKVWSMNTQYSLNWDWNASPTNKHGVTFTVQYLEKRKFVRRIGEWQEVCKTPYHRCDLTSLNLYYWGIYMVRVRANLGNLHSEWVMKEFCPDREAALGPPSRVDLAPAGSLLDVSISDPLTSNNGSMKEKVTMMYYRIIYWERSEDPQSLKTTKVDVKTNLVTLPDLKAWTWYCVSIQSREDNYNKSSSFTAPHCMQTEGDTPWWHIVLYFMASLIGCFVLVLPSLYACFWCLGVIKSTFYPTIQLPPYIHEYFESGSDIPHLLTPESSTEQIFDKVSICSKAVILEIHTPPHEDLIQPLSGLEQDSSGRHSRQGSGGSGDSGVYSTEGGSSLQQPDSGHSSLLGEDARQCTPLLVKMEDMGPEPRGGNHFMDEGVMDMCV